MQILQAAEATEPLLEPFEIEPDAALQNFDHLPSDIGELPVARLAAACAAARRVLCALNPPEGPLAWPEIQRVASLDEKVQAGYARAGSCMLAAARLAPPLPADLMHGSAQLFKEISVAYARGVEQIETGNAAQLDELDPALRILRALWCMGMSAKWIYFMNVASDGSFWRQYHALFMHAESLGVVHRLLRPYRDPDVGALTCADVYVQTLLLGMLNAGNLLPQQIELAHRWVVAFVRNAGIEPRVNGDGYVFHVCLDSDRGLQDGVPPGTDAGAVRFIDIEPVCARLVDSRESLRRGRIDLGEPGLHVAVLDYGAFLDLAERFWTPGSNKVRERAPRVGAKQQPVDAVTGFDALFDMVSGRTSAKAGSQQAGDMPSLGSNVAFLHREPAAQPAPVLGCLLKDQSETGVGLLLPRDCDAPQIGTMIGFQLAPSSGRWELGVLVRRLAAPDGNYTLLGIKRISSTPIAVTLRVGKPGAAPRLAESADVPAIFAPMDGNCSRIDSLILRDSTYTRGMEFVLPTGDSGFHVGLTRVLERGAGWLRAAIQVFGKA